MNTIPQCVAKYIGEGSIQSQLQDFGDCWKNVQKHEIGYMASPYLRKFSQIIKSGKAVIFHASFQKVLKGKRDYLGVKLVLSFQKQNQRYYVLLSLYIYLYDTQSNPPLVKLLTEGEYAVNPNAPYIEKGDFVKTNFIREWEENPDFEKQGIDNLLTDLIATFTEITPYVTFQIKDIEVSPESVTIQYNDIIGWGNDSIVYHATYNQAKVAVKESFPNPRYTSRLHHSYKIEVSLSHPNILKSFGYTIKNKCTCLIMEYADGGNLKEYLKNIRLSTSQRKEMILSIVHALQYTLKQDMVHLGLKLENIFVVKNCIKIGDFSANLVSQYSSRLSQTYTSSKLDIHKSSTRLSLSSISDNQQKLLIERKEDIYALGVLIQEIMLGPAFMESYVKQQTKGDLQNEWSPPHELSADPELFSIVNDCMLPYMSRPSIDVIGSRLEQWSTHTTPEIHYLE